MSTELPGERGIQLGHMGQDFQIAMAQHRAAIGGPRGNSVPGGIFVAMGRNRRQDKAEPFESGPRALKIGHIPTDVIQEYLV